VILIADFEGGDASFKHVDAEHIMNGLEVSFTLDGTALPTTRTAIKRFLNPEQFGLEAAYYFQQGQIMSPADLSIGSHRLEVTMLDASIQQSSQDGITFVIDPWYRSMRLKPERPDPPTRITNGMGADSCTDRRVLALRAGPTSVTARDRL